MRPGESLTTPSGPPPGSPPAPTDIGEFRRDSATPERDADPLSSSPPIAGSVPAAETAHPQRIGRYRILEVLGQGGMGTVYLAEQTEPIRRQVAIKVIRASRRDAQFTHRFEAERQALARMSHPCIAQVYEAGDTESGQPFFAMEHVPGEPITDYCDRERLSIDQRLDLFVAVCRGIHHAHQKGILHRDIKPPNILVATEQGRPVPKIIDFGVAKMLDAKAAESPETVFGVVLGTPSYLSPESIAASTDTDSADPDTRSDVYALGILLFELLVGERPFGRSGESLLQILRQVTEGEVPAPSVRWRALTMGESDARAAARATGAANVVRSLRGDLDWITLKATSRLREMRYDSAAELANDIERHRRFEPVHAGPPGRLYVLGKFARRYRAALLATGFVILALVGGVAARTLEARRANREAAAARQAQAETAEVVEFLVDLFEVNDPGIVTRQHDHRARVARPRRRGDPAPAGRPAALAGPPARHHRSRLSRPRDLPSPRNRSLREALAIREASLGPNHPDVADDARPSGRPPVDPWRLPGGRVGAATRARNARASLRAGGPGGRRGARSPGIGPGDPGAPRGGAADSRARTGDSRERARTRRVAGRGEPRRPRRFSPRSRGVRRRRAALSPRPGDPRSALRPGRSGCRDDRQRTRHRSLSD